jgi:uncharacterized membrane-anchored protein
MFKGHLLSFWLAYVIFFILWGIYDYFKNNFFEVQLLCVILFGVNFVLIELMDYYFKDEEVIYADKMDGPPALKQISKLLSFVKWIGIFYLNLFNGGINGHAFEVYVIFITVLVLDILIMLHFFIVKKKNISVKK